MCVEYLFVCLFVRVYFKYYTRISIVIHYVLFRTIHTHTHMECTIAKRTMLSDITGGMCVNLHSDVCAVENDK